MVIRLVSMLLAVILSLLGAAPARAVSLPISLTVTDGINSRVATPEGEFTGNGNWDHAGTLSAPTYDISWFGTAVFGDKFADHGAFIVAELTNHTAETQHYVIDLSIDTGGIIGGANIYAEAFGGAEGSGVVIDAHGDGIPFLSLVANGAVVGATPPLEFPITDLAGFHPYVPPGGPWEPPLPTFLFEPALYDLGSRVAFSLTPGDTARIGTGVGGKAAIPEPSGLAIVLIALGFLHGRRCRALR